MAEKAQSIEVPKLTLKACSVEEHCCALLEIRRLPLWWYQGTSRLFGNYSLPFQDRRSRWWYQVKPGLAWPVDFFRPIDPVCARPSFARTFLGYQHVVPDEAQANSHLVVNTIRDLGAYGPHAINSKRRNAVRKGLKACDLDVLTDLDSNTIVGCRAAWNDLTSRTGWKHAADEKSFSESWHMLRDMPGVSIIVGREHPSGEVAGFLVTKIIGDTAYVDTIASRTDMLRTNVNDAVMYAFLVNVAALPGVCKAHYAIKSYVTNLERFKQAIGFESYPWPARTRLRPGVALGLKMFFRASYNRMVGRFEDEEDGSKMDDADD